MPRAQILCDVWRLGTVRDRVKARRVNKKELL